MSDYHTTNRPTIFPQTNSTMYPPNNMQLLQCANQHTNTHLTNWSGTTTTRIRLPQVYKYFIYNYGNALQTHKFPSPTLYVFVLATYHKDPHLTHIKSATKSQPTLAIRLHKVLTIFTLSMQTMVWLQTFLIGDNKAYHLSFLCNTPHSTSKCNQQHLEQTLHQQPPRKPNTYTHHAHPQSNSAKHNQVYFNP